MKGKDFAQLLTEFTDVLSDSRAAEWRHLPPIFNAAPESNVVEICSVLSGVKPPKHGDGSRLQEMLHLLSALRRLLTRGAAKKTVVDDLQALETALTPFGDIPTDVFTDAAIKRLRERVAGQQVPAPVTPDELIQSYLRRLEAALGQKLEFQQVFDDLKNDKSIKVAEARKLSKKFAKEGGRTRNASLDLIWGRHAALLGSRARKQANTGRTAA